ncbi:MAG: hypothetical protein PHF86_14300 [Candidatus Nanoarchaeia archaeon]|jgi:hypothetical protein|nr:hypothetical protein [Candidatus Nanoarchaeia archaeon]
MKRYKKVFKESVDLNNIINQFQKLNYKVEENDVNEYLIYNKKGFEVFIKLIGNKLHGWVPGYKTDINLGEIPDNFNELKKLIDGINKTWMKNYDPYGDKW